MGNYFNLFKWTKWLSAVVHASMMHDYIINSDKLGAGIRAELEAVLERAAASDISFADIKDPLHGNTLLHTAVKAKNYHLSLKLIRANANFIIPNNYLQDVFGMISNLIHDKSYADKDLKIVELLKKITDDNKVNHVNAVLIKVWKEQPLFSALRKGKINSVCLLLLLGGQVASSNESNSTLFNLLLKSIHDNPEKFSRAGVFKRWFLTRLTNAFGNTLLLRASQSGLRQFPELLLASHTKTRNKKDGFTALHSAARGGNVDLATILVERGGADVNAIEFSKQSPLHVAVASRHPKMVEFLLKQGTEYSLRIWFTRNNHKPSYKSIKLSPRHFGNGRKKTILFFFVVLTWISRVLDGFDRHYQATAVHFFPSVQQCCR